MAIVVAAAFFRAARDPVVGRPGQHRAGEPHAAPADPAPLGRLLLDVLVAPGGPPQPLGDAAARLPHGRRWALLSRYDDNQ